MDKFKKIFDKYKVILTIIILLIASFLMYLVVSANEDIYENQITVTNSRVNIIDGSPNKDGNFDSNDEAGNDSANNNKIVRNFDQIVYDITYSLGYKETTTLDESERSLDITRSAVIDILVPSNLDVVVSAEDRISTLLSNMNVVNNDVTYKYYKYEIKNAYLSQENSAQIILSEINGKNGDVIAPIIRVREETDVDAAAINENTDVTSINKLSIDNVTVSAKENYAVKLYKGIIKKEEQGLNSTLPLGLLVYLPNDENKGIKGISVPENISFDLIIESSSSESTILSNPTISNYSSDSEYIVTNLPYSYVTNNGNATIESENYLNQNKKSSFNIKFTNLQYHNQQIAISDEENVYSLSSKIFVFNAQKSESNKNDIIYNISTNLENSNVINDYEDSYVAFVGDYTSKIDFFTRTTSSDLNTPLFAESGKAIYNYNEEFYVQNTINYGVNKGDKLTNGFTNYIKIDNTAFTLINTENVSDQSKDYYIQFNNTSDDIQYNVKYGLGEWDDSYFKLKSNRPSYCPSSLSSISKEELMQLYGGPCIEENNIQWVNTIEEAIALEKQDKIIIFKLDVTSEYQPGVETIVRLKAKTVKNYSNIGNTFEIVSRGKTKFNNKDYYLSEIPRKSVESQSQDLKYKKTEYSDNQLVELHSSYVNSGNATTNIGNTVLISAFKSSINSIKLYDAYGSQKTIFYSSITDPIEFEINPVIYKSDYTSVITEANVYVYLPESLEIYEKSGDKPYNKTTSGNIVTIDGVNYKEYIYNYSELDIRSDEQSSSGTIPNLVIHAYISIKTKDMTSANVIVRIGGKVKITENNSTEYTDVTSIDQRTMQTNLTLRNTKDINTIGKVNTTKIDENGSYTYNMRAANSTSNNIDMSLIYILPYSGDNIGDGSNFDGTIKVSILDTLPTGYKAYYTNDNAKIILNNELSDVNNNWNEWTNTSTDLSTATAIKIVPASSISKENYFGSENGITLKITTNKNKESNKYFNNFYIIQKNADVCVYNDNDECSTTEKKTVSYSSNISQVSVYNRIISGKVFEDNNYNGFYDNEATLKDISVDLYKLSATTFDAKNPIDAISEKDELLSDTLTDSKGSYLFEGLSSGNYYVKYTFDCEKYTVTEKNKTDLTMQGDTSSIDSDAQIINANDKKVCYAVSNIVTLNNNVLEQKNIDLGLRIRQEFSIEMKKYITNVKVISNGNILQDNNYDNKSKVSVSVKNLKNVSFRVTYGIEIQNTKYFPGTIGSIVETIPVGMTFDPSLSENEGWYESNGNLYYAYLNKTLIMPGEKYHLTITLDLKTDSGGDYINIVAANNLQIKQVVTNFLEVPEEVEIIEEGE